MTAAHAHGPIGPAEAAALLQSFEALPVIALAVSGGADSTALLHLADLWHRAAPGRPRLVVLTVDHGLRAGSKAEATRVAALAEARGIEAKVLVWDHGGTPPAGDIQAAARAARYDLLAKAARAAGAGRVLLAHHQDDVAETLLMRIGRGSGLRGLAGMPAERRHRGIRFLRPLIGVPKARLVATLQAAGIGWFEDPSNRDQARFQRARIRAALPLLAEAGLTADRLADTAARLAAADQVVAAAVAALDAEAVRRGRGAGSQVIEVDRAIFCAAPAEIGHRLLGHLLMEVRPADYPPRAASIEGVIAALGDPAMRRRTLGGVVIDPKGASVWLYPEAGRAGFPRLSRLKAGRQDWDGRIAVLVAGRPPADLAVVSGGAALTAMPARAAASLPRLVDGAGDAAPSRGSGYRVMMWPIRRFPEIGGA